MPMYENKNQQLAPRNTYLKRIIKSSLIGILFLFIWLCIGILGYKYTIPQFDWYDSLLNASMILSGMGPMIEPYIKLTVASKIFASFYAIVSGIIFISVFAILIAPIVHRFFHKLHIEDNES